MVRVLIADRQTMFRQGVGRLLTDAADFAVVAEADVDASASAALGKSRIDIAVLEYALPARGGVAMIRDVKAKQPAARTLIVAGGVRDPHLLQALHAGADGYITKEDSADELVTALRRLAAGRRYICPSVAEQQTFGYLAGEAGQPDHMRLSHRELEIFRLLASGMRGLDIAYELSLSEKTVSTHKTHMLKKLKLRTVAELVQYAIRHDLVSS